MDVHRIGCNPFTGDEPVFFNKNQKAGQPRNKDVPKQLVTYKRIPEHDFMV